MNFNKILNTQYRTDIVCVCGEDLHIGELWCPRCKAIAKKEIKTMIRVPSGFSNSDLAWAIAFALLLGFMIGFMGAFYVL